jgi:HprK-related kinase A
MKIGELSFDSFFAKAASIEGFNLDIGLYTINLRSNDRYFLQTLQALYADFPCGDGNDFVDFHIKLFPSAWFRRWLKPQIQINLDGREPFQPFSADHAMPLFEWGLNWCIVHQGQHNLMLHAAVLEKHGKALILPAVPGSGKSTLAAALAQCGWRFLSDEFCMIRPADAQILPIPRPTPLKNESIHVIRQFAPKAYIGPLFDKTRKGTVGHLRAPAESVERMHETATPGWVMFPQYHPNVIPSIKPISKNYAFMKLAINAFNYDVQGGTGFNLVKYIINRCAVYNLNYNKLEDVVEEIARLTDRND